MLARLIEMIKTWYSTLKDYPSSESYNPMSFFEDTVGAMYEVMVLEVLNAQKKFKTAFKVFSSKFRDRFKQFNIEIATKITLPV